MTFPMLENVLWLTGFVLNTALFTCLQLRLPKGQCSWFKSWIGLNVLETSILFGIYKLNNPTLYAKVFWTGAFLDCAAQAAVLVELARSVLTRKRRWVGRTKHVVATITVSSLLFSGVTAWTVQPAALTQLDSLFARSNLFLTSLVCMTFTGIVFSSRRYGLSWSTRAEHIGSGLGFWTAVSFVSDILHAYWRTMPYFDILETVRTISFQLVLVYWIARFGNVEETTQVDNHFDQAECHNRANMKEQECTT